MPSPSSLAPNTTSSTVMMAPLHRAIGAPADESGGMTNRGRRDLWVPETRLAWLTCGFALA